MDLLSFPGFLFHPTDEELISYYLKKKSEGEHEKEEPIANADEEWYTDIMKDEIITLDDILPDIESNSLAAPFIHPRLRAFETKPNAFNSKGRIIESNTLARPTQGTAPRRIRLRNYKRFNVPEDATTETVGVGISGFIVESAATSHTDKPQNKSVGFAWLIGGLARMVLLMSLLRHLRRDFVEIFRPTFSSKKDVES